MATAQPGGGGRVRGRPGGRAARGRGRVRHRRLRLAVLDPYRRRRLAGPEDGGAAARRARQPRRGSRRRPPARHRRRSRAVWARRPHDRSGPPRRGERAGSVRRRVDLRARRRQLLRRAPDRALRGDAPGGLGAGDLPRRLDRRAGRGAARPAAPYRALAHHPRRGRGGARRRDRRRRCVHAGAAEPAHLRGAERAAPARAGGRSADRAAPARQLARPGAAKPRRVADLGLRPRAVVAGPPGALPDAPAAGGADGRRRRGPRRPQVALRGATRPLLGIVGRPPGRRRGAAHRRRRGRRHVRQPGGGGRVAGPRARRAAGASRPRRSACRDPPRALLRHLVPVVDLGLPGARRAVGRRALGGTVATALLTGSARGPPGSAPGARERARLARALRPARRQVVVLLATGRAGRGRSGDRLSRRARGGARLGVPGRRCGGSPGGDRRLSRLGAPPGMDPRRSRRVGRRPAAVRVARAGRHLPRRRGLHRRRPVLARRGTDEGGAPGGQPRRAPRLPVEGAARRRGRARTATGDARRRAMLHRRAPSHGLYDGARRPVPPRPGRRLLRARDRA